MTSLLRRQALHYIVMSMAQFSKLCILTALQLRPVKAAALLSAGDTSRVTNLAAIADSLDCLADIVQAAIIEQNEEVSPWAERSLTLSNKQRSVEFGQVPATRNQAAMLDGLDDLVDR